MTNTAGRNRLPKVEPKCKGDTWYLQFNWKGEQKYLSFGTGKTGKTTATAKAHQILGDLQTGNFDPSLDKYRVNFHSQELEKPKSITQLELFKKWMESLNLTERQYYVSHYRAIERMIEKYCPKDCLDSEWFEQLDLAKIHRCIAPLTRRRCRSVRVDLCRGTQLCKSSRPVVLAADYV